MAAAAVAASARATAAELRAVVAADVPAVRAAVEAFQEVEDSVLVALLARAVALTAVAETAVVQRETGR